MDFEFVHERFEKRLMRQSSSSRAPSSRYVVLRYSIVIYVFVVSRHGRAPTSARAFGGFGLQGDPASVAAREITS